MRTFLRKHICFKLDVNYAKIFKKIYVNYRILQIFTQGQHAVWIRIINLLTEKWIFNRICKYDQLKRYYLILNHAIEDNNISITIKMVNKVIILLSIVQELHCFVR